MNRLQRALDTLVERVDTPAPIVLVDVMQDNIDRMQGFADQHNLDVRPHVKTHKCVEIGRRQVEAGAVGITAGNVGEAEVFAAAGFDDIFLAYPVWPAGTKGTRIHRLAESTRLRVGVVVSAGSTPTVEFSTSSLITEIRPGEYVFCDLDNARLGACTDDQIALFVAATVVSDWVPDQVILDVGTKALGREGGPERGYGGVAGTKAALSKLNEYHGFLPLPADEFRPGVGTVVPVVPNHVCPVVPNFEELIVTDSTGTSLWRWPVDARGLLG